MYFALRHTIMLWGFREEFVVLWLCHIDIHIRELENIVRMQRNCALRGLLAFSVLCCNARDQFNPLSCRRLTLGTSSLALPCSGCH